MFLIWPMEAFFFSIFHRLFVFSAGFLGIHLVQLQNSFKILRHFKESILIEYFNLVMQHSF